MRLMQIYGVRALQYIRKRRQHRRPQAVKICKTECIPESEEVIC